jgi:tRNA (guanine26-N2/guanine27-N2)-dimethyltransferase
MAPDRDLNVAVVRAWRDLGHPCPSGWEMLAATGVRGLRVVHEAGTFERFELTERDPRAAELLGRNAARYSGEGARATLGDARTDPPAGSFDYVDLDPYGTPVPFLDAAFRRLAPGGLLAVTATDTRVLAGVDRGVAERRYGGRPVRGRLGPEGGLRLLLAEVARLASARGSRIAPRLAYVGSHHVRAYLTVADAAGDAPPLPVGAIDPERWTGPPLGAAGPVGPFWLGPLLDAALVGRLRPMDGAAEPRALARKIEILQEEVTVDRPFFYESNSIAEELGLASPPSVGSMAAELAVRGFRTARTQSRPGAFRTDAPCDEVRAAAQRLSGQSQNDRVRA